MHLCHAGCILAELYTGYPLFPGENEVEQLACIMEVLGAPPEDVIMNASRRRLFFGLYTNIQLPEKYISYFPAHKMHRDFFIRNFRKK